MSSGQHSMQKANKRNTKHIVAIPDEVWGTVCDKAKEENTTRTHVVEQLIAQFIDKVEVWTD